MRTRIFVLDRGFVLVGQSGDFTGMGLWIPVHNCRCIRRWGTQSGLAQLRNGPTATTQMDDICETVTVPVRAIVQIIEVDQKKWEKHLKVKE